MVSIFDGGTGFTFFFVFVLIDYLVTGYGTYMVSSPVYTGSSTPASKVAGVCSWSLRPHQVPRLSMDGAVFALPRTFLWSGPRSNAVASATK